MAGAGESNMNMGRKKFFLALALGGLVIGSSFSLRAEHWSQWRGPFFNGPNQFAVHFTFEVTPKAPSRRITLEEVGVYAVKDDKITREQFFYDGER